MEENKQPRPIERLSRELSDRLTKPILRLTEEEIEHIEEFLGIEMIVEPTEEPGLYGISRFSMANSFINDADPGMRLTVRFEYENEEDDEGLVAGIKLVSFKDVKEPTERGLEMAERETLPYFQIERLGSIYPREGLSSERPHECTCEKKEPEKAK